MPTRRAVISDKREQSMPMTKLVAAGSLFALGIFLLRDTT